MRIAICGPKKDGAISKAEKAFNVNVVEPWAINGGSGDVIDCAAATYTHNNEKNVVFSGFALDYLVNNEQEGYFDVYEQIALNSLVNLDSVVVIADGMDEKLLNLYKEYSEIYPKIVIYPSVKEYNVTM